MIGVSDYNYAYTIIVISVAYGIELYDSVVYPIAL